MTNLNFDGIKKLWPGIDQIQHVGTVVKKKKLGEFYIIAKITSIYFDVTDSCPYRRGHKMIKMQETYKDQRICWCGRPAHKVDSVFYVRLELQDLVQTDIVYGAVAFEKNAADIIGVTAGEMLQMILSKDTKLHGIRADLISKNAVFKIIVKESTRGFDKLDWHIKKSRFVGAKETARILKHGTNRSSTFKEGFAKLFNIEEKKLVIKRKNECEEEDAIISRKKLRSKNE